MLSLITHTLSVLHVDGDKLWKFKLVEILTYFVQLKQIIQINALLSQYVMRKLCHKISHYVYGYRL